MTLALSGTLWPDAGILHACAGRLELCKGACLEACVHAHACACTHTRAPLSLHTQAYTCLHPDQPTHLHSHASPTTPTWLCTHACKRMHLHIPNAIHICRPSSMLGRWSTSTSSPATLPRGACSTSARWWACSPLEPSWSWARDDRCGCAWAWIICAWMTVHGHGVLTDRANRLRVSACGARRCAWMWVDGKGAWTCMQSLLQ